MIPVVSALIQNGKYFLICQRPAHKERPLSWEFPGGKVEDGESPEEALRRECLEELGVELEVGQLFMETEYQYPEIKIKLALYKAQIKSGRLQKLEHEDIRWISVDEAESYDFCPADRAFIKELKK